MKKKQSLTGLLEFLLLILGVSIALGAENWLSGRADARRAESYIRDVQADLNRDFDALGIWSKIFSMKLAATRELLSELDGSRPPLSPSESTVALFLTTIPTRLSLGSPTYVDLTGSGDLRLLPPSVRKPLVQYEVYLSDTDGIVDLLVRPMYIGFVPAEARITMRECYRVCSDPAWSASYERLIAKADTVVGSMTDVQLDRLMAWSAVPDIARLLDLEAHESHRMARRMDGARVNLDRALAAVTEASN